MYSAIRRICFAIIMVSAASAATIDFSVVTLATNGTDSQLINPWGITAAPTSPFWIGSNGSGVSEIYSGAGVKNGALVVAIPGDGSVTGVAFNGTGQFNADNFLFVSEDGTVAGWRSALGSTAETLQVASANNVYKGMAIDTTAGNNYALLANFRNGTIDVIKGNAGNPNLSGFVDPSLPSGYAPFDVQNLNGAIYVTYAKQDSMGHDEVDGAGFGFVDQFDLNGNFVARIASGGLLNAPWGLAIAPNGFGDVGGDLLVGNFGDGSINAYTTSGTFVETLDGMNGLPLAIDGLWGMRFGNGSASGGSTNSLFITAGPNDESGGLFAQINVVPEPSTWLLAGAGLAALIMRRLRKAAPPSQAGLRLQ